MDIRKRKNASDLPIKMTDIRIYFDSAAKLTINRKKNSLGHRKTKHRKRL